MKRTGKLHIDRFLAATAAGEDEKAEALVPLLTAADIPALHAMVVASDVDIRWWAIRALAEVGNAASVRILVDALANDDADLRAVAAMSLGELHTTQPAAVNACLADLAARLADEDGQVRMAAVTALIHCGDDAVPVLAAALADEQDGVRVHAARALHGIGSMKAAPPLYHHLEDSHPLVRHYAYETLERLGLLENLLFTR
ncbi:MAG: HEAT repeat domain-containing protein [Caldilineaceae bacterium]|nr:HEAT repeat domain-containing protein [Caldilineaceae bacterium]